MEELDHWTFALRLAELPVIDNRELDKDQIDSLNRLIRSTLHFTNAIIDECGDRRTISEAEQLRALALALKDVVQRATALNTLTARSNNFRNAVTEITRIYSELQTIGRCFCDARGIALAEWFDAATQRA